MPAVLDQAEAEAQAAEDTSFIRTMEEFLEDVEDPAFEEKMAEQTAGRAEIPMEGFGTDVDGAPLVLENPAVSNVALNADLNRARVGQLAREPQRTIAERPSAMQAATRGRLNRRELFQVSAAGLGGMSLLSMLPGEAVAEEKKKPFNIHECEKLEGDMRTWAIGIIKEGLSNFKAAEAKWKRNKAAVLAAKSMDPKEDDDRESFKAEMQFLMAKVLPEKYKLVYPDRVDKDSPWKKKGQQILMPDGEVSMTTEVFCLGVMRDGRLVPVEGDKAMWTAITTDSALHDPELNRVSYSESLKLNPNMKSVIDKMEKEAERAKVHYVARK